MERRHCSGCLDGASTLRRCGQTKIERRYCGGPIVQSERKAKNGSSFRLSKYKTITKKQHTHTHMQAHNYGTLTLLVSRLRLAFCCCRAVLLVLHSRPLASLTAFTLLFYATSSTSKLSLAYIRAGTAPSAMSKNIPPPPPNNCTELSYSPDQYN